MRELDTTSPQADNHSWSRRATVLLEVTLVFCVFAIRGGGGIPSGGEAHYLARAKHLWNPQWCPFDSFCNSPDAHLFFDSTFGALTLLLPLPAVALYGRILTWGLLAWAWQRMGRAMVDVPFVSVLSAAIFIILNYSCHLAGEWVVGGVEAKCFAYIFVFLAIEAMARNRWNWAWLLLGMASAFHVLVGGWTAIAAACAYLLGGPGWPPLRATLPGLLCGGLLALIGLVPALALTWHADAATVAEANQISVFERLPHHLWPQSFSSAAIGRHLPVLVAWLLLFCLVRPVESQRALRRIVNCSLVFSVLGWLIGVALDSHPEVAARLLRYYWFRLADVMLPIGVAMLGVSSMVQLYHARPRWGMIWGAAVTLATTLFVTAMIFGGPRTRSSADVGLEHLDDWRKTCAWIADNTPADAVFLTPRLAQTFHWYAQRAEVVSRKNCPQDAAGIVEWWRRLQRIYRGPTHWANSVNELGTQHVLEVGQLYRADFAVTLDDPSLDLPVVGPLGSRYVVYRLPRAEPDKNPP
jgi:hypothetical protein